MTEPFLGEIRPFSFNFAPKGWAMCNGQILPINQYAALFSLLGTQYGGNGQTTFALPNLQSRSPIHIGGSETYVEGDTVGVEAVTLVAGTMPTHRHQAFASAAATADQISPAGALWANSGHAAWSTATPDTTLDPGSTSGAGGGQPHNNISPYLTINYCIALQGIFPSRN
jgi:microcystin-dependent protein